MSGLGKTEERDAMWERSAWRNADVGSSGGGTGSNTGGVVGLISNLLATKDTEAGDEKLSFEEVERMCKRLGVGLGRQDLRSLFQVRVPTRNYLC